MKPEASRCPICESGRISVRKRIKTYTVWGCKDCELYWVPGVTEADLDGFYNFEYFKGEQEYGYSDYIEAEHSHRRNARRILDAVLSHTGKKGRLLDVGSAHGFLVDEACRAGWGAEGVELSRAAHAYAANTLNLKWAAAGFKDTELGVLMKPEVGHGTTQVYARVQG